ncbi:MAG: hypothetical protein AMXMBFR33_27280 [Candidatus Xenobia bacterium]
MVTRQGHRMSYNAMERACHELGVCVRTLRRSYNAHARELGRRIPLS